ncbi:MAG TPA: aspartyl/asparaginyl beta-hydroxylase domain-containing protein [Rhizomicrobium sp.]|nr:aspartyl/asparaginyl beta-hydroxylase domain-containing protein [Rhizomicrobium sp.]
MAAEDPRIIELTQRAFSAMGAGRLDEAGRLWSQLHQIAPQDPQALLHLGQMALRRGEMAKALELLDRAAAAAPKEAVVQLNLAFAARSAGRADIEGRAYESALVADPYCYPAMLGKAELFEKGGKLRQAARFYKDALSIAPPPEQQPPQLAAQFAHARETVRKNGEVMKDFLQSRLGKIESEARPGRFDQCVDALVGQRKIYVSQPSLLHYPGLPSTQFFDNALFPWLKDFEAATETILNELKSLLAEDAGKFQPYVAYKPGTPVNQWGELNHSPRWSGYFLWEKGDRIEEHCARCPKTVEAVEKIPLIHIPGFAPTVMFSVLLPHTHIPPHTGVTNTRLIGHLPLIVPDNCRFRVGNETRKVEKGKAWLFDDSIEHEAWNDSDEIRIILMIDVWNPNLDEKEHDLIRELLMGMREYYREDLAALGGDTLR